MELKHIFNYEAKGSMKQSYNETLFYKNVYIALN